MRKDGEKEIKLIKKKPDINHYHEENLGTGTRPKRKMNTIKRKPSGNPPTNVKPKKPTKKIVQWSFKSPEPQHLKVSNEKPGTPEVKKVQGPNPIALSRGRKRVKRLITAKDGHGVGANKGQSIGNKIQRTKDKIKRVVKPWMGKEQYYNDKQEIDKKTYKTLKRKMKKAG